MRYAAGRVVQAIPLLLLVSVATPQPTSAFAAGFAAGAGAAFVLSFLKRTASRVGGGGSGTNREEP